jgi:hypothetical protein
MALHESLRLAGTLAPSASTRRPRPPPGPSLCRTLRCLSGVTALRYGCSAGADNGTRKLWKRRGVSVSSEHERFFYLSPHPHTLRCCCATPSCALESSRCCATNRVRSCCSSTWAEASLLAITVVATPIIPTPTAPPLTGSCSCITQTILAAPGCRPRPARAAAVAAAATCRLPPNTPTVRCSSSVATAKR